MIILHHHICQAYRLIFLWVIWSVSFWKYRKIRMITRNNYFNYGYHHKGQRSKDLHVDDTVSTLSKSDPLLPIFYIAARWSYQFNFYVELCYQFLRKQITSFWKFGWDLWSRIICEAESVVVDFICITNLKWWGWRWDWLFVFRLRYGTLNHF